MKKTIFALSLACFAVLLITACKRNGSGSGAVSDYFQTPFQDECQFIVQTIVTDVAEQLYYAKFHKVPEVHVSVVELAGTNLDAPVYDVRIDLDSRYKKLKYQVTVNGPIWSPEVYDGLADQLGQKIGLAPGSNEESKDTDLLAKLTDARAATVEEQNQKISAALAADFTNPTLHEQAALLLGAFTLREHSGDFLEIRSPLCRLTSHLVMARYLGGNDARGINGKVAQAILLTLMKDQAEALTALKSIPTNNVALGSWVRALQARNTDDYRQLDKMEGLSTLECIEWFQAREMSGNGDIAWSKLSDDQKKTADFVRIANQINFSVGQGHELLNLSIPAEYQEIGLVYELSQGKKLTKERMVEALNAMPERCVSPGPGGQNGVHVIGWGLWAGFLQRQLCQAVMKDYNFLQRQWGVPDDARTFVTNADQAFGGLRLYPFVRRFNAIDSASYHKSVDDGFKVTVATPQLVPAQCWNFLCYEMNGESYQPNPNPHVNEWHKHNPPPGTAYDLIPRLYDPSLVSRADAQDELDRLHERAPYNWDITYYIYKHKYHGNPTYAQAEALFSEVLAYKPGAIAYVADTVKDQPERCEMLLSEAAELNPTEYFNLADYCVNQKQDDKAATYLEKGGQLDPDSLEIAARASWLVRYYLKNGRKEDARKIADFAGEVYSDSGLQAKAQFLEATGDYDGAYQWYSNIGDRYDDFGPLFKFCHRYKEKTGDTRFDAKMQELSGKMFPSGIEKVAFGDFKSAPADGVRLKGESDLLQAAGLKNGDIIVALSGVRVHNFAQYESERDMAGPEMDLIVWQGNAYQEIKASPPDHLFGVEMVDYRRHK